MPTSSIDKIVGQQSSVKTTFIVTWPANHLPECFTIDLFFFPSRKSQSGLILSTTRRSSRSLRMIWRKTPWESCSSSLTMISLWVQLQYCLCPARRKTNPTIFIILAIYSCIFWNPSRSKCWVWTLADPVCCFWRQAASPFCLVCGRKPVWPWNQTEFKLHSWRPQSHGSNLWTALNLKELNI